MGLLYLSQGDPFWLDLGLCMCSDLTVPIGTTWAVLPTLLAVSDSIMERSRVAVATLEQGGLGKGLHCMAPMRISPKPAVQKKH